MNRGALRERGLDCERDFGWGPLYKKRLHEGSFSDLLRWLLRWLIIRSCFALFTLTVSLFCVHLTNHISDRSEINFS